MVRISVDFKDKHNKHARGLGREWTQVPAASERSGTCESSVSFAIHSPIHCLLLFVCVFVQSTPLSERVSFLEGKGMTKEEIQEAIDRHQKSGTAAEVTQLPVNPMHCQEGTAPRMMTTAAVPMQQMMSPSAQYPAYIRVLWTVSSLIGAASIVTFIWNYAVELGYIPWLVRHV